MMEGTITDKSVSPEFTFQAAANDVIFLHPPDCIDRADAPIAPGTMQTIFFSFFDPNGKMLDLGHPGCELGRIELPVAGTYTFKINTAKNQLGHYSVPIRFIRHNRTATIKYGDIVSGNIEQKAAHDVYAFTAKAGDLIQLFGKGCELDMFTSIIDPDGHDFLGPGCRSGDVSKLSKDGTYKLVINSGDGGPGKYQFVFQGVSGGEPTSRK